MTFYFCRHAKRRMKWRQVSEEEVQKVIHFPDRVQETLKGRVNAWRRVDEKLLKVTYKQEHERMVIVSVIVVNK